VSEEPRGRSRVATIGWLTFGLGAADVLRLVAEMVSVGFAAKEFYYLTVLIDLVLGGLGVVFGFRLTRDGRPTWAASVVLWGAWVGNSVVFFSSILYWVLDHYASQRLSGDLQVLGPRLLFYVLTLVLSPWVLWSLLTQDEPGRPPRSRLWRRLFAGFTTGFLVGIAILSRR
jgi:hypothetical protein